MIFSLTPFFLVRFFPNNPNTRPTSTCACFSGFCSSSFRVFRRSKQPAHFSEKAAQKTIKKRQSLSGVGSAGKERWAMGGSTLRPCRRRRRRRRRRRSPHTVPSLTVFNLSLFSLPSPSRLHDQRPFQPHEKRREMSPSGVLPRTR